MSCARLNLHRSGAGSALRQRHLGLTLFIFLLAGARVMPALAQITGGESQNPAGTVGGPENLPTTGGGVAISPGLPGPAPTTLPPVPGGGFGLANPAAPPYAVDNEAPPLLSPPSLRLAPVQAAVAPLQLYDPNAPAILIQPHASLGERFTDNVNYVHSPRKAAAITTLGTGLSVSADTPRLQAVFTSSANGNVYLPSSNSSLNQIYGSLYGNGLGTIVPDALFVDFQNAITQSTPLPGLGFQNLSQLPRNQQTQVYINNISPFLRKSFGGVLDTELRYRFGASNYGGNTAVATTPGSTGLSNLSSSTLNEGTFIAATGQDFERALSRLTVDASQFNSSATTRNSQVSGYDDLEYRFTPTIAVLARAGYQNIHYPFAPAATFVGPTWLVGGRVGTVGPDQPGYASLEYGRQQGVYGFSGSARFNITPTMVLSGILAQGIGSPTQGFQNSLANSTLSPAGAIVDQYSGLPTAFYSPGLGLTNNVYRQHLFNVGVTDVIGSNSYSLFGFYYNQQSLTPQNNTAPTKGIGINFGYSRDIRPDLSGSASLGYVNATNAPTLTAGQQIGSINTATAALSLNYVLGRTLTGSVLYSLSYQTNGATIGGGRGSGDVLVNQLQFVLSKTF